MRLMRYSYQRVHAPGKDLTTADTLSRAPFHRNLTKDEKLLSEDLNLYVSHRVECLPTTACKKYAFISVKMKFVQSLSCPAAKAAQRNIT